MKKRKPLEIKKSIMYVLKKQGEMSLRDLDIKVNTSYQTVRDQVDELSYFGLVEVVKHDRNPKTGRPYTSVKLKKEPAKKDSQSS